MAKTITTFALLKEAIADELDRTDIESAITGGSLPAAVEMFIGLCEDELEIHPAIVDERRTQLTVSTEVTTLPTTANVLQSAALNQSNRYGPIEVASIGKVREMKQQWGTATGHPRAAAITSDGTELVVVPVPDQAYTVEVVYEDKLNRLNSTVGGATVTSNWVLDKHANIYLYGSLKHAELYLKNDDRVEVWKRAYETALERLKTFHERRRYPNQLVARPNSRRVIGG